VVESYCEVTIGYNPIRTGLVLVRGPTHHVDLWAWILKVILTLPCIFCMENH
jgi:hypothetical protein